MGSHSQRSDEVASFKLSALSLYPKNGYVIRNLIVLEVPKDSLWAGTYFPIVKFLNELRASAFVQTPMPPLFWSLLLRVKSKSSLPSRESL